VIVAATVSALVVVITPEIEAKTVVVCCTINNVGFTVDYY